MTTLKIELPSWEMNKNELAEVVNKMQAIELNMKYLAGGIKELEKNINADFDICAYLSDQYDEFYIKNNDLFLSHIEVVTMEIAEQNDIEELRGCPQYSLQEIKNDYEVGGSLSSYKKLGNSEFYYREM